MFKGTTKRPEATDISRALEAVGAEYNAFTNKDHTGYYVKIDSGQQEIAFDLLSDMLYHSVLDAKEMAKEPTSKPIQPDFILILGRDADQTQSGIENTAQ